MNDTPKINGFQSDVKVGCVAVRTACSYVAPSEYDQATARFQRPADPDIKDVFLRRPGLSGRLPRWSVKPTARRGPRCPRASRGRPTSASTRRTRRSKLFEDAGDDPQHCSDSELETSAIYLSGNRLGRLMKQWGYTTMKKGNSEGVVWRL